MEFLPTHARRQLGDVCDVVTAVPIVEDGRLHVVETRVDARFLVMVAIAHSSTQLAGFDDAHFFAVNILAEAQQSLSVYFATREPGRRLSFPLERLADVSSARAGSEQEGIRRGGASGVICYEAI